MSLPTDQAVTAKGQLFLTRALPTAEVSWARAAPTARRLSLFNILKLLFLLWSRYECFKGRDKGAAAFYFRWSRDETTSRTLFILRRLSRRLEPAHCRRCAGRLSVGPTHCRIANETTSASMLTRAVKPCGESLIRGFGQDRRAKHNAHKIREV